MTIPTDDELDAMMHGGGAPEGVSPPPVSGPSLPSLDLRGRFIRNIPTLATWPMFVAVILTLVLCFGLGSLAVLRRANSQGSAGIVVYLGLSALFFGGGLALAHMRLPSRPTDLQRANELALRADSACSQLVAGLKVSFAQVLAVGEEISASVAEAAAAVLAIREHSEGTIDAYRDGYMRVAEPVGHDLNGGHALPRMPEIPDPLAFVVQHLPDDAFALPELEHSQVVAELASIHRAYAPAAPPLHIDLTVTEAPSGIASRASLRKRTSGDVALRPAELRPWEQALAQVADIDKDEDGEL